MSKKAIDLDFSGTSFKKSEWPDGTLEQMSEDPVLALFDIRSQMPSDAFIYPSPVAGAHVRKSGTSRHSTRNGKRLSDATDFFVPWEYHMEYLTLILMHEDIGGMGIYTDMLFRGKLNGHCMFHIDCRPEREQWYAWREDRNDSLKYISFRYERKRAMEMLMDRRG